MATVLLNSEPVSIIRRHSGMISVVRRKLITSELSFFTSAPMTPSDVNRRYSNGRDFEVVLRNGYKKRGIWAVIERLVVWMSLRQMVAHTIQEEASGLAVTSHTLEQSQRIAHSVGGSCSQL